MPEVKELIQNELVSAGLVEAPEQEETQEETAEEETQEQDQTTQLDQETATDDLQGKQDEQADADDEQGAKEEASDKPKQKKIGRARKRIEQLSAEKSKLIEELAQARSDNQGLNSRLDSLETRVTEAQKSPEEKKWESLSADQLAIVAADTENYNTQQRARAISELTDRKSQSRFDELKQATDLQQQQAVSWQNAVAQVKSSGITDPDFNIEDRNSRLFEMANQIFATKLQQDPSFKANPNNHAIAVSEAVANLAIVKLVEQNGKVKGLQKQAGRITKGTQLEGGGRVSSTSSPRQSLIDAIQGKKTFRDVIKERIVIPE